MEPDRSRRTPDAITIELALELLSSHGIDGLGRSFRLLLNEAMKLERSQFLQAGPYERTEERRGYANGFKSKSVKSRLGRLDL